MWSPSKSDDEDAASNETEKPLLARSSSASPSWNHAARLGRRQRLVTGLLSAALCVSLAGNWHARARPGAVPAELEESCPPEAFDSGSWVQKPHPVNVTDVDTFWQATGFAGCSAERYFWSYSWEGDHEWTAFTEPLSLEWQPNAACKLREPTIREKLQSLVDDGGLLLIGDSVTYQHYFSISCDLYPHVKWGSEHIFPEIERIKGREQCQHLFLDPSSPVVQSLRLPAGFDMEKRPVVTWHGTAIGVSTDELRLEPDALLDVIPAKYANADADASLRKLTSNWTIGRFHDPANNYRTLLLTWGAHITDTNFPGADDVELQQVLRSIFRVYFRNLLPGLRKDQRVIVRAASPGHALTGDDHALEEMPIATVWHNWASMPAMNQIARQETVNVRDSRFFYMNGERVARSRPDAHIAGDPMHLNIGAGVLEGWTKYLWHRIMVQ